MLGFVAHELGYNYGRAIRSISNISAPQQAGDICNFRRGNGIGFDVVIILESLAIYIEDQINFIKQYGLHEDYPNFDRLGDRAFTAPLQLEYFLGAKA